MSEISNLSVIHPAAVIAADVKIGPFCVIGPEVSLGPGCVLMNHVTLDGRARIGPHNIFYPNTVVGVAGQDLKYRGGPTETIIGAGNTFREAVTVHRGTELGCGQTVIGDHNLFMVAAHIAHDCIIGSHNIISNQTQLAGHVTIEDGAVLSALIGVHHFVTIGRFSYVGAMTPVRRDVPPFMKYEGDPNEVRGVNKEGLKRTGFTDEEIEQIERAYKALYRGEKDILSNLEQLESANGLNSHVKYLCQFVRSSCAGRFGRYRELLRRDQAADRQRNPEQSEGGRA